MSGYVVESSVPVPAPRRPGRAEKYPWSKMAVGDSFFVENGNSDAMSANARGQFERHGRKFTLRKVDNGVRVWRTE